MAGNFTQSNGTLTASRNLTVTGNLTRTGGTTSVAGNTTVAGTTTSSNTTSTDTTTPTAKAETHQSSQVQGGTLLSPPLPKLEDKGVNELPVFEVLDPFEQSVLRNTDQRLIVNSQSSADE